MSRNKKSNAANNWRNRQARAATAKKPAMRAYCGRSYKPTGCRDLRPYSAGRPDISLVTPAKQKHIDELKARRERREARRLPKVVGETIGILSDNPEWCAFDYQPERKPIPYRALTSTGHMNVARESKTLVQPKQLTPREQAGRELAAMIATKHGIASQGLQQVGA